MPPSRNQTGTRLKEQKKNITARLMTISLKADDYIYKNKRISVQDAEAYALEMESFKIKCQDERYLQVIEKLTSYMKCIIREESPNNIIEANLLKPIVTESNKELPADKYKEYTKQYDILDEMELKISNLLITNFQKIDDTKNKNQNMPIAYTTSTITKYKDELPNIKNSNAIGNKIITLCDSNKENKPKTFKSIQNNTAEYRKDIISLDLSILSQNMPTEFKCGGKCNVETYTNALHAKNTNKINQRSVKTKLSQSYECPKKKVIKRKQKNTAIKKNNMSKVNGKDAVPKKAGKRTKRKTVTSLTAIKNDKGVVSKKNNRNSAKNKNEIIDLSWVEDFKFIREIDMEEHTKLDCIDESFWNDSILPPNMNISDFEYDNINIWKN